MCRPHLLLADHSSVFGLPHEQDFIFLCCKHHQHLGCEETGTERILTEERERTEIGHVGVEQDERSLDMDGLLAVAIDPCYISKAGKKTAHIGTFWPG